VAWHARVRGAVRVLTRSEFTGGQGYSMVGDTNTSIPCRTIRYRIPVFHTITAQHDPSIPNIACALWNTEQSMEFYVLQNHSISRKLRAKKITGNKWDHQVTLK
jgi:hypothetical protein